MGLRVVISGVWGSLRFMQASLSSLADNFSEIKKIHEQKVITQRM